ncbi:autotransporter outer membrane beta-barrel domain-containing protein [Brucellaceae bacterium C25G]
MKIRRFYNCKSLTACILLGSVSINFAYAQNVDSETLLFDDGQSHEINNLNITTDKMSVAAVEIYGDNTKVILTDMNITTAGAVASNGIEVKGKNNQDPELAPMAIINNSVINRSASNLGIYASNGGIIEVNDTTINLRNGRPGTSGFTPSAVAARYSGATVTLKNVTINDFTDEPTPIRMVGLYADLGATINADNLTYKTDSFNGQFIRIMQPETNINIKNSIITVSGLSSHAFSMWGGNINFDNSEINVTSENSIAISSADDVNNILFDNKTTLNSKTLFNSQSNNTVLNITASNNSEITGAAYTKVNFNATDPVANINLLSGSIWNVSGNSNLTNLINDNSFIKFAQNEDNFSTLTVNQNYSADNGVIFLNTALGDDASATDKLVIEGDTSGTSFVHIVNAGGSGALTNEGIEIITVGGESNGEFKLKQENDTDYIVAGAYTYRLHKNNASGTSPNDWYLRSQLTPEIDPEPEYHVGAPVYEVYAQSLLGLNGVSTLQQRVGNRFWAVGGNRAISEGADTLSPYASIEEAGAHIDSNGVWGRIEGAFNHIEPRYSTTDTSFNQSTLKLQAGIDGVLSDNQNGFLIGGFFAQYVHGKTKLDSTLPYADGNISTNGYGVGGTLTWYGNEGFYIDGQAQATWYKSDLSTKALNAPTLIDGNKGFGYALSIEAGKKLAIDQVWSVTPQAQLTYSRVKFDSFDDGFDSRVSHDKGASLQGRFGLTLDHVNSWQNNNGLMNRSHVYGIANLYYEFLEGTKIYVEDVGFSSKKDRLWGGLGVGGSYNWDSDKYSVYGEGLVNTSLNHFSDSYSVKGNIGFKMKW